MSPLHRPRTDKLYLRRQSKASTFVGGHTTPWGWTIARGCGFGGLLIALGLLIGARAKVGDRAPDFTLKDQKGKEVSLSDYKGKIVVIHWFNMRCDLLERHYKAGTFASIHDQYKDRGVAQMAIDSTGESAEEHQKAAEQFHVTYPILGDEGGKVAKTYGAKTTPHVFIIDKQGKVAYSGAVDDDPDGKNPKRIDYVRQALEELLAGRDVSVAETAPYGCPIRYDD